MSEDEKKDALILALTQQLEQERENKFTWSRDACFTQFSLTYRNIEILHIDIRHINELSVSTDYRWSHTLISPGDMYDAMLFEIGYNKGKRKYKIAFAYRRKFNGNLNDAIVLSYCRSLEQIVMELDIECRSESAWAIERFRSGLLRVCPNEGKPIFDALGWTIKYFRIHE